MSIKEMRIARGLTQRSCAEYLGIPLRTYKRYESDEEKISPIKREFILSRLANADIDEDHGILSTKSIISACEPVLRKHNVDYCYLFGSYAKGTATETSDVDLMISTTLSGLAFFGLVEELRETLNKRVDVLDQRQLQNNIALTEEILKEGIKIYG